MADVDHIVSAQDALNRIGGVNGNGVSDLAPLAIAHGLIACASELRALRQGLAETSDGQRLADRIAGEVSLMEEQFRDAMFSVGEAAIRRG